MQEISKQVTSWAFRQNGPFSAPTSMTLVANLKNGRAEIFDMAPAVAQDLLRGCP